MRLRWVAGTGRVFEFKETIGMAGDETLVDEFDDDATDDIDQFEEKQEVQAAPVKDPDPVTIERRDGPVAGRTTPTEKDEEFSTAGGAGAGGEDSPDYLGKLTAKQRAELLKNNSVIAEADGTFTATAFVMAAGKGLDWASRKALRCKNVELNSYLGVRKDNGTTSYSEWESKWQQQTDAKATVKGGIPGIFKASSSFQHSSATSGYSGGRKVYFQFSYRLTKARLVLGAENIELTPEFNAVLRSAAGIADPIARGKKFFELFEEWGQFVAMDTTLGGRITLTKEDTVTDTSKLEQNFTDFSVAAGAAFSVEGLPADAEGGTGVRLESRSALSEYLRSKRLEMDVVGGIDKRASSDQNTFAEAWLASVDHFERWSVIGFQPSSVQLITEFLPADIKESCLTGMRQYFLSRLMATQTDKLGKTEWTTNFEDWIKWDKAIRRVRFRYDKVLDSLHTEWELDGKRIAQGKPGSDNGHRWHGGAMDNEGNGDDSFELSAGEEITAVEVTLTGPVSQKDATVRKIAFYTSFGRRFPNSRSSWYGGASEDNDSGVLRVSAPRVRGFCGTMGNYIDSIGLKYYAFRADTVSPEFLDSMTRYLFPR